MPKYLSEDEIREILINVKSGDEEAWKRLYENFENYVHKRAWKRLQKLDISDVVKKDIEADLYQAGWQGFIGAVRNYDLNRGSRFLTYATYYIDGEISKELDFRLNPMGLTEQYDYGKGGNGENQIVNTPLYDVGKADVPKAVKKAVKKAECYEDTLYVDTAPDRGKYSAERRVLQIIDILKILTDENHKLSKEEIGRHLALYRVFKYKNGTPLESPNTLTSTLEDMLLELNPEEYREDCEDKYRVKYDGYQEDRLKNKLNKDGKKKSAEITGFSYVHPFDYKELDRLIQLVCFSDMLDVYEKETLVKKLVSTSSAYYETPYWDGMRIKYNPKGTGGSTYGNIYGRFSAGHSNDRSLFIHNLKVIQYAVNNLVQIRFKFNRWTAEHKMIPKADYIHVLSPYHLVVYRDNYYCIGMKKDDRRIWHYRVDLMSEVEIIKDEGGKEVPIEITSFEGNPICNANWNSEKYMAEHLNMAYDEPQDIRIKIKDTDYTIIHDWFGDNYKKTNEPCEEGYDIVRVRTSPSMIVHWALQYGTAVEIMNEDIRENINKKINEICKLYKKT